MMKRDGHTHTEYCPHGNIEDVELLIRQAIVLGFKEYSITEHAPLSPSLLKSKEIGGPLEAWTTGAMALNDVEHYFKRMNQLKSKYSSDILIHIGFELDYLAEMKDWTREFLNEYGPLTDDGVLSLHFLPGKGGLRSIDFTAEDYKEGIIDYYGSFQKAQVAYYQGLLESIESDLGLYKPKRIGHISLCQKFQLAYAEDVSYSEESLVYIHEILSKLIEKDYQLDLNTAGLAKSDCLETYPPKWLIKEATKQSIPLIYGSDSHRLTDIGQGYEQVKIFIE